VKGGTLVKLCESLIKHFSLYYLSLKLCALPIVEIVDLLVPQEKVQLRRQISRS
jgi:hypothetical protein